jgi:hypothetical protein
MIVGYRFGVIIIFAVDANPEKIPIVRATSKSKIINDIAPIPTPAIYPNKSLYLRCSKTIVPQTIAIVYKMEITYIVFIYPYILLRYNDQDHRAGGST